MIAVREVTAQTGVAGFRPHLVMVMLMVMVAVSGCGADRAHIRICEQVARAIEHDSKSMNVLQTARHPNVNHAVILDYRVMDATGRSNNHWISCRFAGGSPATGPRQLVGVTTDRDGVLSPIRVAMLQIWLRVSSGGRDLPVEPSRAPGPPSAGPAYLVQHLINAVPLGSVYALIAVGFSVVWGVLVRFRFSVGALITLFECTAILALCLMVVITADRSVIILATVLMAVLAVRTAFRGIRQRKIFGARKRPLAAGIGIETHSAMIAMLGLAWGLREAVRLAHGSHDLWLEPVATTSRALFQSEDFAATVSSGQIIVFAVAATMVGFLSLIITETAFGRRYRACRDDIGMAALAGVNMDRIVGRVLLLGAACTALAGAMITFHYGTISLSMGAAIGLKALVAAVVGGLGSVGGAAAGGVAVGVFETLAAAYLAAEYRDLALFGMLTVFLALRFRRLLRR